MVLLKIRQRWKPKSIEKVWLLELPNWKAFLIHWISVETNWKISIPHRLCFHPNGQNDVERTWKVHMYFHNGYYNWHQVWAPKLRYKRKHYSFSFSYFFLILLCYKNLYQFLVGEDKRKYQQGDGREDKEKGEFRIRTEWQLACTGNRSWRKKERENGSDLFW